MDHIKGYEFRNVLAELRKESFLFVTKKKSVF